MRIFQLTWKLITVDCKIFVVKNFSSTTFSDEIKHTKYFVSCTLTYTNFGHQRVWWRNLDYTKNLQVKYFTGENIPIYGTTVLLHKNFRIYGSTFAQGRYYHSVPGECSLLGKHPYNCFGCSNGKHPLPGKHLVTWAKITQQWQNRRVHFTMMVM